MTDEDAVTKGARARYLNDPIFHGRVKAAQLQMQHDGVDYPGEPITILLVLDALDRSGVLDAVQPAEPSDEEVERLREALQAIRDTKAVNGQVVPEFIRATARAALTAAKGQS